MFKAQKPKVPPTFDGVDYDDNKALKAAQDSIIREQWVQSMMARLIREELGKCYWREGVDHLEKCGQLRGIRGLSLCLDERGFADSRDREVHAAAQARQGDGLSFPATELHTRRVASRLLSMETNYYIQFMSCAYLTHSLQH